MPASERAELTVELEVITPNESELPPGEQVEAARNAAAETGLAREAGPDSTMLVGGRREVLEATVRVLEAALDAGARVVHARVEAEADAPRFGE